MCMENLNKDFYSKLPSMACEVLAELIKGYKEENWFKEAWEEYRQHCLSTPMMELRMPGFVFSKYIK